MLIDVSVAVTNGSPRFMDAGHVATLNRLADGLTLDPTAARSDAPNDPS